MGIFGPSQQELLRRAQEQVNKGPAKDQQTPVQRTNETMYSSRKLSWVETLITWVLERSLKKDASQDEESWEATHRGKQVPIEEVGVPETLQGAKELITDVCIAAHKGDIRGRELDMWIDLAQRTAKKYSLQHQLPKTWR